MFYTLLVVGAASILLITANNITSEIGLQIHSNNFINGLAKYQAFALILGLAVTILMLVFNPNSRLFLNKGDLNTIAAKEVWLGINGISSWKKNGIQLLIVISTATGIFMLLAVKYTNSLTNFQLWFIPFIVLFSFTNSLAEELIFRFSLVAGLFDHYSKFTILVVSAVLFGVPHFFGWPNGILGVIMAGVLGYVLCKATIETKGFAIAWIIHFVQDVIIFTALFMMNIND